MSEGNLFSCQTQLTALVVTEGLKPECPYGTVFCNETSGRQWNSALYLIERLGVSHVIVIGDIGAPQLLQLIGEAQLHGLDITFLPQGADVTAALH